MLKGPKIRCLFLALLGLALLACSPRCYPPEIIIRDSIRVEIRDSLVYKDSVVSIPIPLESDQAIVTVNDTSHRETSLAESDAWVGLDGLLHHNLRNKTGNIDFHVAIPEHWIVDRAHKEKADTITRTVYVEKPLTRWQKLRIEAFWWLLCSLLILLLWTFRKQVLRIL